MTPVAGGNPEKLARDRMSDHAGALRDVVAFVWCLGLALNIVSCFTASERKANGTHQRLVEGVRLRIDTPLFTAAGGDNAPSIVPSHFG